MDKKEKKYFLPIIIFLIIQNYISSELFFIIGSIYLLFYIGFKNKAKVYLPFKEYIILIIFLIWGVCLGLISMIIKENIEFIDFIRDVFYFINPLIYIYIGSLYAKERINIHRIFNSFIISGAILSLIAIIETINNMAILSSFFTVQSWRNMTGDGVMVAAIALAIIFAGSIPSEYKLSRKTIIFTTLIMGVEFCITLSRTNILIFLITYLVFALEEKNYKKFIKNIFVIIIIIAFGFILMYKVIPDNVSRMFFDKMLNSIDEINSNHQWTTPAEIEANWRGYETYSAGVEWKNSGVINQIIGNGLGKRIYVGTYAYDLLKQTDSNGNKMDSIAVLHNGYATMLIKLGILGVILYIVFYLLLIKKARITLKLDSGNIYGKILLTVGLILIIQTYFLNGLYKDYCFYPIIILLGYSAFNIQYNFTVTKESKWKKNV